VNSRFVIEESQIILARPHDYSLAGAYRRLVHAGEDIHCMFMGMPCAQSRVFGEKTHSEYIA